MIRARLAGPDWQRVEVPEEGDAVVMRKGAVTCHVGIGWDAEATCCTARGPMAPPWTPLDDPPGARVPLLVGYFRTVELRLAA
jgi:hypothetical protein